MQINDRPLMARLRRNLELQKQSYHMLHAYTLPRNIAEAQGRTTLFDVLTIAY